jgi:hypothetical protein
MLHIQRLLIGILILSAFGGAIWTIIHFDLLGAVAAIALGAWLLCGAYLIGSLFRG